MNVQAVGHGISHAYGNNWDRTGSLSGGKGGWGTHRYDHINAKPHKLFGSVSQRARSISKVSMFNGDILAIAVAVLLKPAQKGLLNPDGNLIGSSPDPNDPYKGCVTLWSLGAAGDWAQGRSPSEPCYEIAPPHTNPRGSDCSSLPAETRHPEEVWNRSRETSLVATRRKGRKPSPGAKLGFLALSRL
jgi:hypothetical protein